MGQSTITHGLSIRTVLPNWPLVVWMLALALALGLLGGLDVQELVREFNHGFGRALGEFALILLPSFVLAAVLSRQSISAAGGVTTAIAPLAGAGMICPDTAYAALSPVAGRRRLDVAFGSYAGFKLLYPAGPLIVATGLGVSDDSLLLYGFALLVPGWAVGMLWVRLRGGTKADAPEAANTRFIDAALAFKPLLILALLLVLGWMFDFTSAPLLDFLTQPKGALLAAAAFGLLTVPAQSRRDCLDTGVRRTASLLFVLGAASAFGGVLMSVVSLDMTMSTGAGAAGIAGLFLLTAIFKLAQGSSMAAFAAITPVAAPLVAVMGIPDAAAVFAICAGSFVTILPNDSFYWLVRKDALAQESEPNAVSTLAIGSLLQGLTGLLIILSAAMSGLI